MTSEMRVEYPSDPNLRSVGRVAVIGVLLRLRMPMMAVEQFRTELDAALHAAAGADGADGESGTDRIALRASWDDANVKVEITGPGGTHRLTRPRIHR